MKFTQYLGAVALLLMLSACSKLNKENYEQLKLGMSQEEVKAIIGSSDSCAENMGAVSCVWGDEEGKHIKVRFIADAAVTFSNKDL